MRLSTPLRLSRSLRIQYPRATQIMAEDRGTMSATWPPTRADLDALLSDWYDWQAPNWADPDADIPFEKAKKIFGAYDDPKDKDAYAARSLRYKPLIEAILAKKLTSADIAKEAVDGRSALALTILLDQHPRTIWRTDADAGIAWSQTDPIVRGLVKDHIYPRKLNEDPKVGGPWNIMSFSPFLLPLMHSERIEDQRECMRRTMARLDHLTGKQLDLAKMALPFAQARTLQDSIVLNSQTST